VGASRISYTDPHGARRQCPPCAYRVVAERGSCSSSSALSSSGAGSTAAGWGSTATPRARPSTTSGRCEGGADALPPLQRRDLSRLLLRRVRTVPALDSSPAHGNPAAARGGLAIAQGWDRRTGCQSRGTPLTNRQPSVEAEGAGRPSVRAGAGTASRPWGGRETPLRHSDSSRSSVDGRASHATPGFQRVDPRRDQPSPWVW